MSKNTVVNDKKVKWIADHWSQVGLYNDDMPRFAFIEMPFDYAVSYLPGTRFGPESIMKYFNSCSLFCTDKRISLENTRFVHFGATETYHSLKRSYAIIEKKVATIPKDFIPICLGGDHSITDPIIRGLKKQYMEKQFGIIVIDSHFDSRQPIPGKEHSGHWVYTIGDIVNYNTVAQLGITGNIYAESYLKDAESKGIMIRTPYDIRKTGWKNIIQDTIAHTTKYYNGVYISVDIDAIDQAFSPGTSVPNPSGLFPYEVIDAIFEISSLVPVLGFDITEVSPPNDFHDFSSRISAEIIMNFIAGVVKYNNNLKKQTL